MWRCCAGCPDEVWKSPLTVYACADCQKTGWLSSVRIVRPWRRFDDVCDANERPAGRKRRRRDPRRRDRVAVRAVERPRRPARQPHKQQGDPAIRRPPLAAPAGSDPRPAARTRKSPAHKRRRACHLQPAASRSAAKCRRLPGKTVHHHRAGDRAAEGAPANEEAPLRRRQADRGKTPSGGNKASPRAAARVNRPKLLRRTGRLV